MAIVNPPVWLEAGTYSATHDRLVTGLLIERDWDGAGTLIGTVGGIVGPKNQMVLTADGTMNVSVSAGVAVVPRQSATQPGTYLCYNDGAVTVAVPTQASQQRNDILVARVNDSEEGNTGDNWEFHLITGTAASTPVDPTIPANYTKIARINVKSAALNGGVDKITTAQLSDIRNFVAAPGGVHVAWNGVYPNSQPGRLVYDPNAGGQIKVGIGGGVWWTLLPDELRAFREAAYGTKSAYHDNSVRRSGAGSGDWDPTPVENLAGDVAGSAITAVNVDAGSWYGSQFKVSVAALARCDADISGHLSVQVRDGATEIYPPAIGKGPSFYGTFWISSENTFIVSLPPTYVKRSVNFRVMFRSQYTGAGGGSGVYARFQRIRLIVEPTLI